jgi:nucleotide-binding universal stress UspA family protein
MTATGARRIRRVLVALDASPGSVAAAAAAARVAAALEAELVGLFVEDRDLLRLSRSPQARQVGFLTAAAERVGAEQMERQLRAQAARARLTLARLATQEGITYTFRVRRGRAATEILASAGPEDLVSVGRNSWPHGRRRRLGSTTRALLERRRSNTLLTDRGAAVAAPLAVLFDGSEAAFDALRLAAQLARPVAGSVAVFVTDREAEREATRHLGERSRLARLSRLDGPPAEALPTALREHRPGLLILPVGKPGLAGDKLLGLLAELRCPVLAVS